MLQELMPKSKVLALFAHLVTMANTCKLLCDSILFVTDNIFLLRFPKMYETISITTSRREQLVDVTEQVRHIVSSSGIKNGVVIVYAQGATAAMMVQENWDESVQTDVVNLLRKLIPKGVWLHDEQDGNGDSHLKAGLVGPSECVPVVDGVLALSTWQNIFFCEFDGPRRERKIVCTVLRDDC
jgi:secondary thiamine-phosphate synthase enzyme